MGIEMLKSDLNTQYESARQFGLASSRGKEAQIFLQDAIQLHRPPSDVRFRPAQMADYGAIRESSEAEFWEDLTGECDIIDSIHRKTDP
jgi:hypothetical protein